MRTIPKGGDWVELASMLVHRGELEPEWNQEGRVPLARRPGRVHRACEAENRGTRFTHIQTALVGSPLRDSVNLQEFLGQARNLPHFIRDVHYRDLRWCRSR